MTKIFYFTFLHRNRRWIFIICEFFESMEANLQNPCIEFFKFFCLFRYFPYFFIQKYFWWWMFTKLRIQGYTEKNFRLWELEVRLWQRYYSADFLLAEFYRHSNSMRTVVRAVQDTLKALIYSSFVEAWNRLWFDIHTYFSLKCSRLINTLDYR